MIGEVRYKIKSQGIHAVQTGHLLLSVAFISLGAGVEKGMVCPPQSLQFGRHKEWEDKEVRKSRGAGISPLNVISYSCE